MATYVLVPGFWLGAWVWEEVAEGLRAAGHQVHAVTLTGLAERAGEAAAGTDVDTHIADIAAVIEDNDLHEVVLVGHSGANMPVTGVGDRMPERLARIVYVDTGPLPSGMAQLDFNEPEERAAIEKQVRLEGAGRWIPVPAFDRDGDPRSLADLTDEQLRMLRERCTPQPYGTAAQPMQRPGEIAPTPRTAILTTFPLAVLEQLVASGNPVFVLMGTPEWSFRELPTGHYPMLTRPRELVEVLTGL